MTTYSIETPEDEPVNTAGAFTIFLAGSIEMGAATAWQSGVARRIATMWPDSGVRLVFWNPRRAHGFNADTLDDQIRWEQERLHRADAILMVLEEGTRSPVSMLEFGEFIASGHLFVACPHGFYRYENLWLTAEYYGRVIYDDVDGAMNALIQSMKG